MFSENSSADRHGGGAWLSDSYRVFTLNRKIPMYLFAVLRTSVAVPMCHGIWQ
jgi:hypothetical protein